MYSNSVFSSALAIGNRNSQNKLPIHITSISHCRNTRETIPIILHQQGFKHKHSTYTALHNICHQIIKGFNNSRPPQRTVVVALDMSETFDTMNIHKLIHILTLTNIPNTIIKFIANYKITKRQACTQYNGTLSNLKQINTGIPQGGFLSPTLFNIYTSDISLPPEDLQIITYPDDITITAFYTKHL